MAGADDDVGRLMSRRPDDVLGQRQLLASLRSRLFQRESPPETVGRYELRDRIGSGAGGVVYSAYDPELKRELAIKILHEDAGGEEDTTHLAARLRREARALAQLSHPHVLPIYDVGEDGQRVFIAMELVDGTDLRQWLDAEARTPAEICSVFAAAAAGLAAAHEQGVVHRDFKPANVLVGARGRVRVNDFGLARLDADGYPTDASEPLTQTGAVVGTPAYMAPEQCKGERAGPAADQFSFCTALVEALAGERPADSLRERRRQLASSSPSLRRAILRGLDSDPGERWPTMLPLARALRPRRRSHSRAVIFVALGAGVAATAAVLIRSDTPPCDPGAALDDQWNPDRRAAIGSSFEASGLDYADDAWERAAGGIDRFAAQWSSAYRERCALERDDVGCLESQLEELDQLLIVFGDADATVVERAISAVDALPAPGHCPTPDANVRDAGFQRTMAELKALDAAGKYEDAIAIARELIDDAGAAGAKRVEGRARYELGQLLADTRDGEAAAVMLDQAAWTAQEAGDDTTAAWAMTSLVLIVGHQLSREEEGFSWARHAAAAIERTGGAPEIEAERLDNLGVLYYNAGKYDVAEAHHRQALQIAEETLGPEHPSTATYMMSLGNAAFQRSHHDEAAEHYLRALEIRRTVLGPGHPRIADVMSNLGNVYYSQGKLDEAESIYVGAIEIEKAARGSMSTDVAQSTHNLANVQLARGNYEKAREMYEHALSIWEATVGQDSPRVAATLNNLASTLTRMHRDEEARDMLERAIRIWETELGSDHAELGDPLHNLARTVSALGDKKRARELNERALEIRIATLGSDHPRVAASLTSLGGLRADAGDHEGALTYHERAAKIRENSQGPDHPDNAYPLYGVGLALMELGRFEDAIAPLRRAVGVLENSEIEARRLGEARYALAVALRRTGGDVEEVRALAQAALQDFVAHGELEQIEAAETRALLRSLPRPARTKRTDGE